MTGIIPRSITSKRHSGQTTGTFKRFKTPRLLQGITAGAKSSGQRNTPKICTGRPPLLEGFIGQLQKEIHLRRLVTPTAPNINPISSRSVFIVHGHDGELKHASARLVTNLGLEPVILHEQANKGRTIIEKFTDHAQVGFVIVLLSADDEGRPRDTSAALLKLRARQNVIFEMGFFFSRLGRERVCVVYESGVELPSDLSGILYVQYDSGKG